MVGNTGLLAEVAEQAVEGARRHAKLGADLFVSFSAGEGAKNNCFLEGEGRIRGSASVRGLFGNVPGIPELRSLVVSGFDLVFDFITSLRFFWATAQAQFSMQVNSEGTNRKDRWNFVAWRIERPPVIYSCLQCVKHYSRGSLLEELLP